MFLAQSYYHIKEAKVFRTVLSFDAWLHDWRLDELTLVGQVQKMGWVGRLIFFLRNYQFSISPGTPPQDASPAVELELVVGCVHKGQYLTGKLIRVTEESPEGN